MEKKNNGRGKKVNTVNKAIETPEGEEIPLGYLSLEGIRVKPWWKIEHWAMVTDPENPFGDLTREEELRITEILKGMR
ncbi:MAG: hypothetical protein ACE5EA_11585 [Nitrospirota bacterium]